MNFYYARYARQYLSSNGEWDYSSHDMGKRTIYVIAENIESAKTKINAALSQHENKERRVVLYNEVKMCDALDTVEGYDYFSINPIIL